MANISSATPLPVKQPLLLKLLLPLLLLASIVIGLGYWRLNNHYQETLQIQLKQRAGAYAQVIQQFIELQQDLPAVQRGVVALSEEKDLRTMLVASGEPLRVLAASRFITLDVAVESLTEKTAVEYLHEAYRQQRLVTYYETGSQTFFYARPLKLKTAEWLNGERGVILLKLDAEPLHHLLAGEAQRLTFWLALLTLGLTACVYLLLRQLVLQPAAYLHNTLQRHLSGDLESQAPVLAEDEMGRLALSVNQLFANYEISGREWMKCKAELARLQEEYRQTTTTLKKSEERYRNLFELSPDAIYINKENRITQINSAGLSFFGASSATQLLGRSPFELLHPDFHAVAEECMQRNMAVQGKPQQPLIEQVIRLDGEIRYAECQSAPFPDEDGMAIQVVARDITRRKLAEEALRASEGQLSEILKTALDAIIIIDEEQRILRFNQGAENIFGYAAHDVQNQYIGVLLPQWTALVHIGEFAQNVSDRAHQQIEMTGRHQDGSEFPAEASISKVYIAEQIISTVILRDITQHKLIEKTLRDSKDRLENFAAHQDNSIERERIRIAREIHDEVGQALTALKMDIGWLQRHLQGQLTSHEVEAKVSNKMRATAEFIGESINMVRRIAMELRPPQLEKVGLGRALAMEAQLFQERMGVAVVTDIAMHVQIDESRSIGLFRVFQEAMTNIARHGEASKVKISFIRQENNVVLEVSNDGNAISPEKSEDPRSLGLMGMRERTRMLGGVLTIKGTPGVGTTVRLELPYNPQTPTAAAA